jgi:hypothetical protein
MKKLGKIAGVLALAALIGFSLAACEEVDYSDVVIQFIGVTADGGENETSTKLFLSFNKPIELFSMADIALSGLDVVKVTLSEEPVVAGDRVTYTLEINGLSASGTVYVKVEKLGFKFDGSPRPAQLYYRVPVNFESVSDNSIAGLTTTQLFLTFDREIPGLSENDITLTGGPAGLQKGELSGPDGAGSFVYTLEIRGFSSGGPVYVSVSKSGFAIFGSPKPVSISYYSPPILFMSVTADGNATTPSTKLTLTFDQVVTGLTAADITLDGIPGIEKGALTGPVYESQSYKYTLAISKFTAGGPLTVSVAKAGFAINDSVKTTTVYYTIVVTFLNLNANSVDGTTTSIVMYFDQPIAGLSASDIELEMSGVNNVIKGAMTHSGNSSTLEISGFTTNGTLRVTVSKAGYTVSDPSKTVNILYATPAFTSVAGFQTWLNGMRANTAGAPYKVGLRTLSDSPALTVRNVLAANSGKYIDLDLSGLSDASITAEAFKDCVTLVSVNVGVSSPSAVTILDSVFSGCSYLTSVSIGTGVSSIGDNAFAGCVRLAKISVAEHSEFYFSDEDVLYDAGKTTLIAYPPAKTDRVFFIPIGIRSISEAAFSGCTYLESVTIPDTVTNIDGGIGEAAFKGCTGLGSVTIPNTVTKIEAEVFSGCIKLATVILGAGVTEIGKEAFASCTSLTSTGLTSIVSGSGSAVTIIGEAAFKGCSKLARVEIPNSVNEIRKEAFANCTSLTEIAFDGTLAVVASIGAEAFASCTSLASFIIPDSVGSLGDKVFSGCGKLATLTIGSGINSIWADTLSGCAALVTLNLGSGVNFITEGALAGCGKLAVITATGNGAYSAANGVLYSGNGATLAVYPPGKTGAVSIAAGVTSIGDSAFKNCTLISGNVFGTLAITSIGDRAFYSCTGISALTIPAGVETIGVNAFGGCTGLTEISIAEGGTTNKFYAQDGVLYNFAKTTLIAYPGGKTSSTPFSIPADLSTVTTIGQYAFYGGNIAGVVIPATANFTIGEKAFGDCSKLTSVEFKGTIPSGQFAGDAFPGDLRDKFYASITLMGTPGVYRRANGTVLTWNK